MGQALAHTVYYGRCFTAGQTGEVAVRRTIATVVVVVPARRLVVDSVGQCTEVHDVYARTLLPNPGPVESVLTFVQRVLDDAARLLR